MMTNETRLLIPLTERPLYELDLWIRQSLRDTNSPERTLAILAEALADNALDLGFVQDASGSWRFAGWQRYGPDVVCIEQVPFRAEEARDGER